ncbi:MAG: ATPase P [Deltaproteobacteria bacterium]|nr:ATPase P [Deltaproteobacteria bacterium]
MIAIDIPGFGHLALRHLVLDFNGTIAFDGVLLPEVVDRIINLSLQIGVHVLTANTTGTCASVLAGLPLTVNVLDGPPEDEAKLSYVKKLGAASCASVGNGANDRLMLEACALGIAVIGPECTAAKTLAAADIVAPDITAALDLLLHPVRLLATLRS